MAQLHPIGSVDDLSHQAGAAADLHRDIIATLEVPEDVSEETISKYCFSLATHLYFLTSVLRVKHSSPMVQYTVQEFITNMDKISTTRQAWGTWPYLILGDHVIRPDHQAKVIQIFHYLDSTLSIGNLSTLIWVLGELWRRRAKGEQVTWQE